MRRFDVQLQQTLTVILAVLFSSKVLSCFVQQSRVEQGSAIHDLNGREHLVNVSKTQVLVVNLLVGSTETLLVSLKIR